jgi:hypothetical protein
MEKITHDLHQQLMGLIGKMELDEALNLSTALFQVLRECGAPPTPASRCVNSFRDALRGLSERSDDELGDLSHEISDVIAWWEEACVDDAFARGETANDNER